MCSELLLNVLWKGFIWKNKENTKTKKQKQITIWTSASSEDGVIEARFTLLSETIIKADKTMFADIEHQTAQDSDSWERGNKWGKRYDCLSSVSEEDFLVIVQGGGTQAKSGLISELKRWNWSSGAKGIVRGCRAESLHRENFTDQ